MGQSSVFTLAFRAEFFEFCPQRRDPTLEDIDDLVANLGRREAYSIYNTTSTINLILGADDHFIGIAIHGDKALGFLNLLHQIIDGHGLGLHLVQLIGRTGLE
jgi:hypothetical protein